MGEPNDPRRAPRSRDVLHAAVAAVAARPGLHDDVQRALGFYESVRCQLDRAAEHVLVLAACHPPREGAPEKTL